MIRLSLDRQPRWITLPCGVELYVQPVTSMITAAALTGPTSRSLAADVRQEERFAALVCDMAPLIITDWRGVAGEDDEPLPVTPEAIASLMALTTVHREFGAAVVTPHLNMVDEKKGLPPSLTGSSAATAAATAPDAAAPENNARKS
jgi:hypothetical protein